MVLSALTVATVMMVEFQDEASVELGAAAAERDALRAEYVAKSGVNLARLIIAAEPTMRAAVAPLLMLAYGGAQPQQLPVWELAGDLLGFFNDESSVQAFSTMAQVTLEEDAKLGLPKDTRFELTIVDEDSKLNVNTAARGVGYTAELERQIMSLIENPAHDAMFEGRDDFGNWNRRETICGAIMDWADFDQDSYTCQVGGDVTNTVAAPEDGYYQRLPLPYERKNAAFDSLEELRLVRGVDDDFWTTFIEPDPEDPRSRNVTVWGQEKVNINTANPETVLKLVLAHASPDDPLRTNFEQQALLLGLLGMLKSATSGVPLFPNGKTFRKAIEGEGNSLAGMLLQGMGLQPVKLTSGAELEKRIGTESKVFSIYATGVVKHGKRETKVRVHTVVDFRGAPPPGQERSPEDLAGALLDPGSAAASSAAEAAEAEEAASEEELKLGEAFAKSPSGYVIYNRVD